MKIIRNLKDYIKDNNYDYLYGYIDDCIKQKDHVRRGKRKIRLEMIKTLDFQWYSLCKEIENTKRVIKKELNIILNRIGINI